VFDDEQNGSGNPWERSHGEVTHIILAANGVGQVSRNGDRVPLLPFWNELAETAQSQP
jgi:hypothetical protein